MEMGFKILILILIRIQILDNSLAQFIPTLSMESRNASKIYEASIRFNKWILTLVNTSADDTDLNNPPLRSVNMPWAVAAAAIPLTGNVQKGLPGLHAPLKDQAFSMNHYCRLARAETRKRSKVVVVFLLLTNFCACEQNAP